MTTLGRGGSDLTAVALAAALGAEVCEIYSDVSGMFTADPRVVPNATLLPVVSYEEMLELSASGTKVLQLRCVEYARNHGVRIHCRSSRHGGPGTVVLPEEEMLERPFITAVAHSTDEARVSLSGPNEPGVAARIFGALAEVNVNVDMIIQSEPVFAERGADLSFTLSRADLETALDALRALGVAERLVTDERIGKVSIVGAGMRSHPNVAAQVFRTVSDLGVNIEMISTSPIRISCVIRPNQVLEVVRALARAFGLERPATKEGKAAPAGGPPPPRA